MQITQIQITEGGTVPSVRYGNTQVSVTLTAQLSPEDNPVEQEARLHGMAIEAVTMRITPGLAPQLEELAHDYAPFRELPDDDALLQWAANRLDTFNWLRNFDRAGALRLVNVYALPHLRAKMVQQTANRWSKPPAAEWEDEGDEGPEETADPLTAAHTDLVFSDGSTADEEIIPFADGLYDDGRSLTTEEAKEILSAEPARAEEMAVIADLLQPDPDEESPVETTVDPVDAAIAQNAAEETLSNCSACHEDGWSAKQGKCLKCGNDIPF